MKKRTILVLCVTAVVVMMAAALTGCAQPATKISDYIRFTPDTVYRYAGTGHALAAQEIYNDYIHTDSQLFQRRITAGDRLMTECLRIADGEMVMYNGAENFYTVHDITGGEALFETVVLKEPLQKGTKWERDRAQIGTTEETLEMAAVMAEVTGENVEVTVPYGTFRALEVTVTTENTEEIRKEYYVKDIGLVKQENHMRTYDSATETLSYTDSVSELAAVEQGADYINEGYFFYPDAAGTDITYETRELKHRTNEDPATALTAALKSYENAENPAFIGEDTVVRGVSVLFGEGKVKVDFSGGLEAAFASDPAREALCLRALINTVGYYFNVSHVCITVEGAGYNGSVTMGADEYKTIDASLDIESDTEGA